MALTSCTIDALDGFEKKAQGQERVIQNVFCCDLLSLVISRAPENCAWVTVMGNLNSVAVATLCDAGAIVIAEDMPAAADMIAAAEGHGISVYRTSLPVYEAARRIDEAIGHAL